MTDAGARAADDSFRMDAAAPDRLRAQGALTFRTARNALQVGAEAIAAAGASLVIDCAALHACDSAGVAVLIEWLRRARGLHKQLHYEQLPEELRSLARISDLEPLLTRGV